MRLAWLLIACAAGFGLTYLAAARAWPKFGAALAVTSATALAVKLLDRISLTGPASR